VVAGIYESSQCDYEKTFGTLLEMVADQVNNMHHEMQNEINVEPK